MINSRRGEKNLSFLRRRVRWWGWRSRFIIKAVSGKGGEFRFFQVCRIVFRRDGACVTAECLKVTMYPPTTFTLPVTHPRVHTHLRTADTSTNRRSPRSTRSHGHLHQPATSSSHTPRCGLLSFVTISPFCSDVGHVFWEVDEGVSAREICRFLRVSSRL